MGVYTRIAFTLFSGLSDGLAIFFPDLSEDLKRSGINISNKEYISIGILTSALVFLVEIPILAFIFGIIFKGILISLITSLTVSAIFTLLIFYLFTKYPKTIVAERSKKIDSVLPFATLFLSTIIGTKLPLSYVFKIFSQYSRYGEITRQIQLMNNDIELFGLDVHTALQRAVDRSPSKKLREMLWGILSTSVSGGDIGVYLREKAAAQMNDYRRSLNDFARRLTLFIEIYLTAVILGAIFFTILTSIFSGIAGAGSNIILLQTIIIFLVLPALSAVFIFLVKISSPAGE